MKKSSMEDMKEEGYPEEYRRIGEAALLLCTWKHTKLDPKEAMELEQLKKKYLGTKPEVPASHPSPPPPPPPPAVPLQQDLNLLPGYNPPDILSLPALEGIIGSNCSKPFEKQLTPSDVEDGQSRLAIHISTVKELKKLLNEDESLSDGIPVTVYDVNGKEFNMEFKVWASKLHVLTGGWKTFCHHHKLIQDKDFVTLRMFRHVQTQKICFLITSRRVPDAEPTTHKRKVKTKVAPSKQTKTSSR
ncbi:hypothetical protein HS088_TW18G00799 [Tripterygium wilfordii]|uniref:TF-B3 domain-containing protein n=1 Tax=Tripterygium wilfordii TaxID=458696 RepID=A0A7J7CDE7_TRIWF|nr:hypothetical protein HS088_TW18G00799 [Tripterygium wilfordii]